MANAGPARGRGSSIVPSRERLRAPAGAREVCHIVGMMMTMTCMMGSRLESITGQSLNLCQRLWPR